LSLRKPISVKILIASLLLVLTVVRPAEHARAQDDQPGGPIYIVQEGDTLWDIAGRFGVTLDDLRSANNITDANQISPGFELVIPGLEGVEGVLITNTVPFGENLRSLSRRYRVPVDALVKLNRITSPRELYRDANLIILEGDASATNSARLGLAPGQALLELAVAQGVNPWSLVSANQIRGTWDAIPGDVLLFPDDSAGEGPGGLPGQIQAVEVTPAPIIQGGTAVIRVETQSDLEINGFLADYELKFFQEEDGDYISLQGLHALQDPGFYSLTLNGGTADGVVFNFSQLVFVRAGDYAYETLVVSEETLDPENTEPEDELWNSLTEPATPERYWDEVFVSPVSPLFAGCWPSFYGSRRSYNGSPFNYFHTGLDFCGGVGAEIYAVAPGEVVFAGELTVRGNATMIDHGWGIYTGYMHQSEILVEEGERVEAGQLIGLVGGTGRVTGSHLHLEVWAGGIQVDPMVWLEEEFP